jgi:hypothetical protein
VLIKRSSRDSATTGFGNRGYQSVGERFEVKIQVPVVAGGFGGGAPSANTCGRHRWAPAPDVARDVPRCSRRRGKRSRGTLVEERPDLVEQSWDAARNQGVLTAGGDVWFPAQVLNVVRHDSSGTSLASDGVWAGYSGLVGE